MRCGDLEPLLVPYVDGEASTHDCEEVERHLDRCPPCRNRVSMERTAREVLVARRPGLRCCASEHLKQRCASYRGAAPRADVAGIAPRAQSRLLSRRMMVQLSMAATVVLMVAGMLFFGFTNNVEALAAQLAVDHVKCFQFLPDDAAAADAVALGQQWATTRGWGIKVPDSDSAQGLQLVTVRRCISTEGTTAHLMYKWRGQPLSVYIINSPIEGAAGRERFVQKLGQDAVVWTDHGRTLAIVGQGRTRELEQLATYVKLKAY